MQIHTLDLEFQDVSEAIAAYLVQGPAGWVLIETGPMTTLSTLQSKLAEHGLTPADIGDVLVTHIHLDHAGAAGWWAQQGARVYVHPVGAPHLIDPSRLWQSAGRIYGDEMETLWGTILPAPKEKVIEVGDGDQIEVAGLTLTALSTPGHAWHHHVYQLGRIAFSGDAVGIRIPGSPWVSLPAPPPEFDRETWHKTLDRLQAAAFQALYLTHFGCVDDVQNQIGQMRTLLDAATAFIDQRRRGGTPQAELIRDYAEWNREQAMAAGMGLDDYPKYEAANPLFMSVAGITRYLRKREEKET